MNTLFGQLEDIAIDRLREFESVALDMNPDGYYLAYSGGKDSDVLLHLTKKSGVKFKAYHHLTTCDPPELVCHVKEKGIEINRPPMTMWQLIRKKGMPPRRNVRYCCEVLKEGGGAGSVVLTGVRWGESSRRAKRKMFEACFRDKRKWFLHPIIEWSEHDIWDYIRSEPINYCKLYDEGFGRLGCVLCPMKKDVEREIVRWPKLAKAWEKAIKSTYRNDKGNVQFTSEEEYWQWWLDRDRNAMRKEDGQCMMFED
jgi:phosphoadenosine phosphosulfate reductase